MWLFVHARAGFLPLFACCRCCCSVGALPVAKGPIVAHDSTAVLDVGVLEDVMQIRTPHVVVVEELAELGGEADVALVEIGRPSCRGRR